MQIRTKKVKEMQHLVDSTLFVLIATGSLKGVWIGRVVESKSGEEEAVVNLEKGIDDEPVPSIEGDLPVGLLAVQSNTLEADHMIRLIFELKQSEGGAALLPPPYPGPPM